MKHAAAKAGINRDTAYTHRRQDLAFAGRWDAAIERGLDDLLGEAYIRATTEKSDRLLKVLLKFRYGDQMADHLTVKVEQYVHGPRPGHAAGAAPQRFCGSAGSSSASQCRRRGAATGRWCSVPRTAARQYGDRSGVSGAAPAPAPR